jgi:2-polyprenyl-6-methoxyphenol hydroxylase-like FAD-dependent oxidoreductase
MGQRECHIAWRCLSCHAVSLLLLPPGRIYLKCGCSPYLAQGVAQAVEDAISITIVLSLMRDKQELSVALQAYEACRKGRVLEIQAATAEARQLAFGKENEVEEARDEENGVASEAQRTGKVVTMMRSTWAYDAAEVARSAMLKRRSTLRAKL